MVAGQTELPKEFLPYSFYDSNLEFQQLLRASLDDRFMEFLRLAPGTFSADGSVVVGEAGFLYVNDGSNHWRKQLSGEEIVDPQVAHDSRQSIHAAAERAAAANCRFMVVIYPEKDIIYPEFSPNVKGSVVSRRSLHALDLDGITVVYPAEAMLRENQNCLLFHRRNSHVSFYGGLIAANCRLQSMELPMLQFCDIPSDLVNWPDDLSIKWVDGLATFRRRVLQRFDRKTVVQPESGHVGTHVQTSNPSAEYKSTVLIFGDSYSWNQDAGLISFLALKFEKVYFVWQKSIDWELLNQLQPLTLILQSAERFLLRGIRA